MQTSPEWSFFSSYSILIHLIPWPDLNPNHGAGGTKTK